MLVQLIVLIKCTRLSLGSRTTGHGSSGLGRSDQIDADAEAWLRRVHFHLSMLLMLFPFGFNLIDSLFQEDLEFSLRSQFFIVLETCCFK